MENFELLIESCKLILNKHSNTMYNLRFNKRIFMNTETELF